MYNYYFFVNLDVNCLNIIIGLIIGLIIILIIDKFLE